MHIPDGFLSIPVWGTMDAIGIGHHRRLRLTPGYWCSTSQLHFWIRRDSAR
jgi:hypothetical protein